QRSPGFGGGLGFGEFLVVVVLALGTGADLTHRYEMQCPVELAIAGPRESVAAVFATGGLDRCRPAVTGVVMAGGEPADISGVPQNLGRQHRPDAVHASQ